MKTAPFDLELAKLGHPLITRDGKRVTEFHYFKNNVGDFPVICILDTCGGALYGYTLEGVLYGYTLGGSFDTEHKAHTYDLFLDLETHWEKPFEFLESVLVKDSPKADWRSMNFVCRHKDEFIVRGTDGYLETVSFCKRPAPVVEEKTTLDVEIKVGGQSVSLEDFKKLIDKL